MKYQVRAGGRSFEIEVEHDRLVRLNGQPLYVDLEQVGGLPLYSLTLDAEGYLVFVEDGETDYRVEVQGQVYPVEVQPQRAQLGSRETACAGGDKECYTISAPLSGRLQALPVKRGDRIVAGQVLAVVESMKMQMELKALRNGVAEAVYGPAERDVQTGEQLVRIRAEQETLR